MIEEDFSGLILSLFDEIDCLTEFVLYHFFFQIFRVNEYTVHEKMYGVLNATPTGTCLIREFDRVVSV